MKEYTDLELSEYRKKKLQLLIEAFAKEHRIDPKRARAAFCRKYNLDPGQLGHYFTKGKGRRNLGDKKAREIARKCELSLNYFEPNYKGKKQQPINKRQEQLNDMVSLLVKERGIEYVTGFIESQINTLKIKK